MSHRKLLVLIELDDILFLDRPTNKLGAAVYNPNVVNLPELQLIWMREESIRSVFGPALERAARDYSRGLLSSDDVMEALQVALMIGDPDYS